MLLRNWIELGVVIAIFIVGLIWKYILRRKKKKIDGFMGISRNKPGMGWKMR